MARHLGASDRSGQLPMRPPRSDPDRRTSTFADMKYYGNTNALILDTYRDRDGTIKRYSDIIPSSHAYRVRGSATSTTWTVEKKRRVQALTKMLESNDYVKDHPASCAPAQVALSHYQPYRKLYGERRYASKYPSIHPTSKKAKGFMDLSGELSNIFYKEWMIRAEPIELLPKSAKGSRRSCEWAMSGAEAAHRKLKRECLNLLRLNKTIYAEASGILYALNKFRFTGGFGWIWFRGFVDLAGRHNIANIQHLTIHIHWPGVTTDRSDGWDMRDLIPKNRLPSPYRKYTRVDKALEECWKIINKAGNLKTLDLILPYQYRVDKVWNLPPFDPKTFAEPPKVKLIHLRHQSIYNCDNDEHPDSTQVPLIRKGTYINPRGHKKSFVQKWKNPKAYAEAQGWAYEIVTYGNDGEYPKAWESKRSDEYDPSNDSEVE